MVPRGYGSRACICKIGRSHVTSHRGSVGRLLGPVQTVSLVVTLFGGAGCRGRDAEKPVTVGAASGELTAAQVTAARNAGLLPNTPLTPDLIYGSSSLPDSQAYGINNAGQVVGFFHDGGWPFVYGQPAVPFIYSIEIAAMATRMFRTELNDQTLSALAVLPRPLKQVAREKSRSPDACRRRNSAYTGTGV